MIWEKLILRKIMIIAKTLIQILVKHVVVYKRTVYTNSNNNENLIYSFKWYRVYNLKILKINSAKTKNVYTDSFSA